VSGVGHGLLKEHVEQERKRLMSYDTSGAQGWRKTLMKMFIKLLFVVLVALLCVKAACLFYIWRVEQAEQQLDDAKLEADFKAILNEMDEKEGKISDLEMQKLRTRYHELHERWIKRIRERQQE
jgi:hypothetical protein